MSLKFKVYLKIALKFLNILYISGIMLHNIIIINIYNI